MNDIIEQVRNLMISSLPSSQTPNDIMSMTDIDGFHKNINSNSELSNCFDIKKLIENMQKVYEGLSKKTVSAFMKEIDDNNIITTCCVDKKYLKDGTQKKTKEFNTKCENIIAKLKEIYKEAQTQNDLTAIEDIEWIIKTLNEENIYEIDPLVVNNEELNTEDNKDGLDFLMQYSKIEDLKQKAKDFDAVRKSPTRRSKTFTDSDKNPISQLDGNSNQERLTNLLSPSVAEKITSLLTRIEFTDFDIFALDDLMKEKSSLIVSHEILKRVDLCNSELIDTQTLRSFLAKVVDSYSRENAYYHNDLHAADVMQTTFTMIVRGDLQRKMKLGDLDKFAILIGAVCHDLRHPGQNNLFHINTRSKIAMRYNDISVLENYHISQTFKLLSQDEYNILKHFKPEEYRILRRRIIEGIIATDMANHQKVLSATKAKIETYKVSKGVNFEKIFDVETSKLFDAQQNILNMCLHTADISNPAKPSKVSEGWTEKVYEEFFRQGDVEKKLNMQVSLMCDRETTSINKAMIGFINFVVMPTIDILVNLIPEVNDYADNIRGNLKKHENALEVEMAANNDKKETKK